MAINYTSQIEQLYVAYFDRPADPTGLAYWNNALNSNGGNTAVISAQFSVAPEYTATFSGLTNDQIINQIYVNLFHRSAESAGLLYWSTLLTAGSLTISNVVTTVIAGAQNADLVAINNKVLAATAFTAALSANNAGASYDSTTAPLAKAWLSGVYDASTEAAAVAPAALNDTVASIIAADTPVIGGGSSFTLTAYTDIHTANVFNAPQVYAAGGVFQVNSLQNEDVLTGMGTNPTLNATLGNPNDNGLNVITPVLNNINTVNVAFSNTVNNVALDLQDSDSALTTVKVSRISAGGAYIQNLHAPVVNLSAEHTQAPADLSFTYLNSALAVPGAKDAVTLTLNQVAGKQLTLGAQSIQSNQIGTVNLVVNAGGASSVYHVDLRHAIGIGAAGQTLKITANDTLILGNDTNGNGSYIEHNNAIGIGALVTVGAVTVGEFTPLTVGLKEIDVAGAGNVTLASVGSAPNFVLNGGTATGNIAVNISNAAAQTTGSFTTGSGNDTVLIDQLFGTYDLAGNYIPGADVTFAGNLSTGAGDDTVIAAHTVTGGVVPVVTYHDLAAGTVLSNYVGAVINTGEGNDTVSVGKLLGANGQPLTSDYAGAYINVGNGNNTVNADSLQTEARIVAGSGVDSVNLTESLGSVYTVIAGDNTGLSADGNGAEVILGAGADNLSINLRGVGLSDATGGALIQGYVDGGLGNDTITISGNKSAAGGQLEVVVGNTSREYTAGVKTGFAVTGVETLTLTSETAYGAGRVASFNGAGDRVIVANDDNSLTANYHLDRSEFDTALATINLNHQDGVIRNITSEGTTWTGFAGSTTTDTLDKLNGTEQINITALEAQTLTGAPIATGPLSVAAQDILGTVYAIGAFTPDLTVNISHDATAVNTTAQITLNSVAPIADPANSPLDPGDVNYDVSINDTLGTYASLALVVNGSENHGVNLNNDFQTALTVTGTGNVNGAVVGNLTLAHVNAATIDTTGYTGNVYIGVESTYNHTINTGIGNDIVRLGDHGELASGLDHVYTGAGNDTVVFNGPGIKVGLSSGDIVAGGTGTDTLAFGGTGASTLINGVLVAHVVDLNSTEFDQVTGFETFTFGVGTGTSVIGSVNDHIGPAQYNVELTQDIIARNAAVSQGGIYTLNVVNDSTLGATVDPAIADGSDAAFTLDLRSIAHREFNVNFTGAGNVDRLIFSEGGLEGLDKFVGGGGTDVLEVRNAAVLSAHDFNGVSGVERLELTTDAAVDQRFDVVFDDTVDASLTHISTHGGGNLISGGSFLTHSNVSSNVILTFDASASTRSLTVDLTAGGVSNNVITTGSGADTILGGAGADFITAGAGANIITGGAGADHFIYTASSVGASDTITDFQDVAFHGAASQDILDFRAITVAGQSINYTVTALAEGASFGAGTDVLELAGTNSIYYVDANHDGVFHAATDVVVVLTGVNDTSWIASILHA